MAIQARHVGPARHHEEKTRPRIRISTGRQQGTSARDPLEGPAASLPGPSDPTRSAPPRDRGERVHVRPSRTLSLSRFAPGVRTSLLIDVLLSILSLSLFSGSFFFSGICIVGGQMCALLRASRSTAPARVIVSPQSPACARGPFKNRDRREKNVKREFNNRLPDESERISDDGWH